MIPRRDVSTDAVVLTSTIDMCVTIPSRTPTIVQRSTMLISLSIENEMSNALHPRAGRAGDGAAVDHHARAPYVDAVELGADDVHVLEHDVVRVLDVDAVLAAVHRDVTQRDVVGTDDDATVDDAADERLRVADHERPLHRAVQVDGRRPDAVGGADPAERDRDDGDRRDAPRSAELTAGLARTRAGNAGRARVRRPGR